MGSRDPLIKQKLKPETIETGKTTIPQQMEIFEPVVRLFQDRPRSVDKLLRPRRLPEHKQPMLIRDMRQSHARDSEEEIAILASRLEQAIAQI